MSTFTSESAPKLITALSLSNFKSLLILTEVDASMSTTGAVIATSVSAPYLTVHSRR